MVDTFSQPDYTSQNGAIYMALIDQAFAALAQLSNQFAAHEATIPDMTVIIDAGILASGTASETIAQQTTAAISAPTINPRIDIITIDYASPGTITIHQGVESATPVAPVFSEYQKAICQINLYVGQTAITNADIIDLRADGSRASILGGENYFTKTNNFFNGITVRPVTTTGTSIAYSATLGVTDHSGSPTYDVIIHITNTISAPSFTYEGGTFYPTLIGGAGLYPGALAQGMVAKLLRVGAAMYLLNPSPAARGALVYKTVDQVLTTGVQAAITWNVEEYDTNNCHDNITNNDRLTVPAGVSAVRLTLSVAFGTNSAGGRILYTYKNASLGSGIPGCVGLYTAGPHATSWTVMNAQSAVLKVVPGDYFRVYALQDSGVSVSILTTYSWFAMDLIG